MKKTLLTILLCGLVLLVGCSSSEPAADEPVEQPVEEPELPVPAGELDEKTSEEALDEVLEEVAKTECDRNGDDYEKSLCFLESLSECKEDTLVLDLLATQIAPEGTFVYEIKGNTSQGCEVTVRNQDPATWSNTCSLKANLFVDCVLSDTYLIILGEGLKLGIDDESMINGLFLLGSNPGCVGDLKDSIDQCIKG